MSTLLVRGLGKSFGAVRALEGVDLDVAAGTRTAVVGPSGSGKTTLLRLVAGFEAPDAGEIRIDGRCVADAAAGVPAHRRNVGLVMQEGALFPHLSVLENIRFGIRERFGARDAALALMDVVELDRTMAGRQPHQLSGGQQQRVALARALARRPRLMLLDEPFSALDTALREQLRRATVAILREAGIATLLVTHDQAEAMGFADQLVIFREGRLVQAGHPRAIYLAPNDPATAAFVGPALVLDAELLGDTAVCALGVVPLRNAVPMRGRGTILVRPEQLSLRPDEGGSWRLAAVDLVGAVARVTLRCADQPALTFDAVARDLPPSGSAVTVAICGPAHAFAISA